jgi:hypothetical protein
MQTTMMAEPELLSLSARQAASAQSFGVASLLFAGVLPALLGALGDEHRLSAEGFGWVAATEALTMGAATALAGMALPPNRLKLVAIVGTLALAAIDFAGIGADGSSVLFLRAMAGVAEGVLLWITVGMIARTETPERWAGIFFTASTAAQLLLALSFAFFVIERFGADGGFAALGVATLLGLVGVVFCPNHYGPLPGGDGAAGVPPRRGWVALFATLIYVAAGGAVGIYLQPLARQAGLSANVARTALWTSLAAQIGGAMVATALAGKVRYFTAFLAGSAVLLGTWAVFSLRVPAFAFVLANTASGFAIVFVAPFLVPMTIEADPSRRTAMQSAGAQLLAGALGPLASARLVSDNDVHGALVLGTIFLLAGMSLIATLHFLAVKDRSALLQRA